MKTTNGDLKSRLRDAGIQPPPSKDQGQEARIDWLFETAAALAADVHDIKTHKFWRKLVQRAATIVGVLSGTSIAIYYLVSTAKLLMGS